MTSNESTFEKLQYIDKQESRHTSCRGNFTFGNYTLLKSDVTTRPLSWIPGMWFTLCKFRLSISCTTACNLRLFA